MAVDATSNRATWLNMQTKLKSMGGATAAFIGEPKSGIQSGVVAILPHSGSINDTNLTGAHEQHHVTLRRYENALQTPTEDIEFRLDQWRANIERDIMGNFTLGGTVAYALPTECSWQYGWVTVENMLYRILDFILVYQVFDRATFTA